MNEKSFESRRVRTQPWIWMAAVGAVLCNAFLTEVGESMEEVGRGSPSDKQKQVMSPGFFQFGLDTFVRVRHVTALAEVIRSMNLVSKIPANCIVAIVLIAGRAIAADAPENEAHVTQIIRDVQLLPSGAAAQPAVLNDTVNENTGVKTGEESRSELTFTDLTITRLGANTVFSFNKAGREVQLDSGAILFRVPKNSGGGSIRTQAVTVGITGTTVIFEYSNLGRGKLTVLEGGADLALVNYPDQSKHVRAGQMLDVKAGAHKLSAPVEVDLSEIMRTSPLIRDFPPLPSQDLIIAAINDQQATNSKGSSDSHGKSTAGSSGKSSSGSPVYHGRTGSDQDDESGNSMPPPTQGRWVNPYLNPRSHPGSGKGQHNTSSYSTPTPSPGKRTKVSTGPIWHAQSTKTNVFKRRTSGNVKPTPTPTPTPKKYLKNAPP